MKGGCWFPVEFEDVSLNKERLCVNGHISTPMTPKLGAPQ